VDGNYDRTDTAGDLNFVTGLLLERRRAQRWQVGPSMVYQLAPRTIISGGYTWTNEGIDGTPAEDEHVVRADVTRQLSPRSAASVGYLERRFVNEIDTRASVSRQRWAPRSRERARTWSGSGWITGAANRSRSASSVRSK